MVSCRRTIAFPTSHCITIDWVSLDIDGVARGELYLEMTYYANSVAPIVAMGGLAVPSHLKEGIQRRPSKLLPSDRLARPRQAINFPPPQNSTSTQVRRVTPDHAFPILPPSLAPANVSRPTPTPNIRNEPHHSRRPTDVLQYNTSNQATGIPISSLDSPRNPLAAPLPSILRPGSVQPPVGSNSPPSGHIPQSSTAPPSLNNPYALPAVTPSQQYLYGVMPPGAQNVQPSPNHTHNPYPVSTSINPYISPINTSPTQSRVDSVASPTFMSGGFYIPPARETNPYMSAYASTIEQYIPPRGRESDPYGQHLPTRYQTPLPLPQRSRLAGRAFSATVGQDVARLETLRRAEEEAAQRRQQELKDLELALQLDRELNLT